MTPIIRPVTVVAGLGRCGSSLMMQMLEAGGMPMTGAWPAFEAPECAAVVDGGTIEPRWIRSVAGHAIKVIDPQVGFLPPGWPMRVIWCRRNAREQAKSHAKFMTLMHGIIVGREHIRAIERSFKGNEREARRRMPDGWIIGWIDVHFEEMLRDPRLCAERVAARCDGLDVAKMAAAVRARPPECAPDMAMELSLVRERRQA